jgi:dTDP-4-dehydrorhamnose reductase
MRILVTGISGQVGAALLPMLRGHDLIAADRTTLDLARPDLINATLDRLAPEFIINPAAYTAVDRAEDERDCAFRVNAEAPYALALWAKLRCVPLIHFSTDYVFDGSGITPWRECDTVGPLSVYGASKLAGEDAIRSTGSNALVIRTSWIYGACGLRTILQLSRERAELRIVADQVGAPTSARAIAAAVAKIVADGRESFTAKTREAQGLVHFSASGETSWYGFANAIVEGLQARGVPLAVERICPISSEDSPVRGAVRPRNSRLALARIRQVFGIEPSHWQGMLEQELDDVIANSDMLDPSTAC